MFIKGAFEKAKEYIESHSRPEPQRKYGFYPCITISRETGAGSDIISQNLIQYLNQIKVVGSPEWTVFYKNLIQKVLEDHNLPLHLQKYLDEDKHSTVASIMTELLTGQPSSITLVQKTTRTILQLANIGNVIIVGRAGNFVTAKLKNCFHVRLVATLEDRIKHVEELYNLNRNEARKFIRKDDRARKNYVFTNYNQNHNDPDYYHLIINTTLLSHKEAAAIIGKAVRKRFPESFIKKAKKMIEA